MPALAVYGCNYELHDKIYHRFAVDPLEKGTVM